MNFGDNLREDGNFFICGQKPMRFYVPRYYYESSLATMNGDHLRTFGIMPVAIVDKDGKDIAVEVLNCPYVIELYSVSSTVYKDRSFFKEDSPLDYMGVDFYPGDRVMKSNIVHSLDNIDMHLNFIIGAKIKNFLKYDDVIKTFDEALRANDMSLNVPHIILEIMVASICRDRKNPETPYGEILAKNPKASQHGYRAASNREIVSRSSVATSIGFEDMDSMIVSAINTTAYDKKQPESPSEKILTM